LQGFVGRFTGATEVSVTGDGRLLTDTPFAEPRGWAPDGSPDQGRFVSADGDGALVFRMTDGRALGFQTADGAEAFERVGFWRSTKALGLFAALSALAAALTLAGLALRNRRELRETQVQSRAGLLQNIQAGLWLTAIGLFAAWCVRSLDPAALVFGWPGGLLVTASACALVAAALTVTALVTLAAIWQGGRRVDSWSPLRKLAFTVTTVIYAAFSYLLLQAGALIPWAA
jgi:hypothetical protein